MKSSSTPTGDWLRDEEPQSLLDGYYCPLYVEPMAGSGERICVAVVAATPEGFLVAPSPGLDRFRCFYDDGAEFLLRLIEEVRFDLETSLARDETQSWQRFGEGQSLKELWKSPFKGFHIGETIWATGQDAGEIAGIGLMMCSSLTTKVALAEQERQETLTRNRLIAQVRGLVGAQQGWDRFFDVSFPALPKTRFDFVGQNLAAHIGILMPNHRRESVDTTKGGTVDLFRLRKNAKDVLSASIEEKSVHNYCVLLHLQADKAKTPKQIEEMEGAREALEASAADLNIRVFPYQTPRQVADQLMELEAA